MQQNSLFHFALTTLFLVLFIAPASGEPPAQLSEDCRKILSTCHEKAYKHICVSVRTAEQSRCKVYCAADVTRKLKRAGINAFKDNTPDSLGRPACVGARLDLGGTEEGARCLATFLGPSYKADGCNNSDGFPYNVRVE